VIFSEKREFFLIVVPLYVSHSARFSFKAGFPLAFQDGGCALTGILNIRFIKPYSIQKVVIILMGCHIWIGDIRVMV
jgi:hypothetical protein